MNIDNIKELCKDSSIRVTMHFLKRAKKRSISYKETKEAIMNSEIIEEYTDNYLYPSCLLLGCTSANRKLHIVVAVEDAKLLHLITIYEPSITRWDDKFKMRRKD